MDDWTISAKAKALLEVGGALGTAGCMRKPLVRAPVQLRPRAPVGLGRCVPCRKGSTRG